MQKKESANRGGLVLFDAGRHQGLDVIGVEIRGKAAWKHSCYFYTSHEYTGTSAQQCEIQVSMVLRTCAATCEEYCLGIAEAMQLGERVDNRIDYALASEKDLVTLNRDRLVTITWVQETA